MPKIKHISCNKLLNSRGDWTIETHVHLDDGSVGEQAIPDGASKGEHEALYVSVDKAIDLVEHPIADLLVGENPFDQTKIDRLMCEMDGTVNKSHLGGNSILSVSLGVAKASAVSKKLELYEYLAELYGTNLSHPLTMPTPVFNILNGGKHAHNDLSFQEFMVIPAPNSKFSAQVEMGVDIYHTLQQMLIDEGSDVDVGDEGGFAPNNYTVPKALEKIKEAAGKKHKVGEDVFFGLDVAAESFWDHGDYNIKEENLRLTTSQLAEYHENLMQNFELIYLEDPFYEKDLDGWREFNAKYAKKLMVIADDLVVTNTKFLKQTIAGNLANAVIVKPNQVGTLTETFEFIKMARAANMSIIISHRSGDVAEDTFIADLAVAVGAEFMKSGAPARGERVAKYNRLLEIFDRNSG